jgi:protein TonB
MENIQTKAWTYSVVLYAGLLLALYFIKIVYEPPQEEVAFGVDLNYGVDLVGSGDIQTLNKANPSKNAYDVKPEAGPKTIEKPTPAPSRPKPQPVVKSAPAKVLTSNEDTKVTVKEPVKTSKPAESKATEAKPTETKAPVKAPVEAPARTVDNSSIMKKSSGSGGSSGSNGTVGTRDGVGGNNNGDGKAGEVGDKGDPRGTPDGKSLYGNPGKGGGSSGTSVNISGWKNRGNLNINKDNSNETGTIVYEVVINDFGDVISIKNRATNLSPSVVSYYREQIRSKLKATLQAEGTPPSRSTGTITIRISRG